MRLKYLPELFAVALACCIPLRATAAGHTHDHASAGPHGGELLELGGDEYHAELVVDEKHDVVTIYMLDGAAKADAPIDAPYLNINVKQGGKAVQFRLAPVRPKGQTQGPTACYSLESASLMKAIHQADANPRLTMRIGKKSYVARIAHNHSHADASVQR